MTIGLSWEAILALTLLGGAVAVDGTSFGQFMISRPFVAAALAGFIVGRPAEGAMMGLVLEAFHLAVLPVGAAKYPEGGPPAVAAGAVYATSGLESSALLLILLGALLLEWVSGESVRMQRQTNVRLISFGGTTHLSASELERRHRAAIGIDFARGMLLVSGGIVVLGGLDRFLVPLWALEESVARLLVMAAVVGLLASALRIVGFRLWFAAAGLAVGVTLLLLTV